MWVGYLRFWRRIRIAPGVTINLSKRGGSLSVGPRGAKVTVGRRGTRGTVGLPGTGLFYTSQIKRGRLRPGTVAEAAPGRQTNKVGWAVGGLAILAVLAYAGGGSGNPSPSGAAGLIPPAGSAAGYQPTLDPGTSLRLGFVSDPTASPRPTSAAHPTARPTAKPKPKPTPRPTPRPITGINGNPWGYTFSPGALIYNPPATFCDQYFSCVSTFWTSTSGYVEECVDGTFSHSGGRSGSCSHHGGNNRPLYSH